MPRQMRMRQTNHRMGDMEREPVISVIMSTYREEETFLRKAIESVLQQTFTEFEYLIAVDAPDNAELIAILTEYAARDRRIQIYVNEKNMGLSASLNLLIQKARGEYIARMDADDISLPTRLETQLSYMREHGSDVISCDVRVIDEKDAVIQHMSGLPSTDAKIKKKLRINNCLPHPGWMVRSEVYRSLEGYRNTPYCEDYEFLLRARNQGYQFGNVNQELIAYRMTTVSISRSNLYRQYLAMKYCQDKYVGGQTVEWEDYLHTHYDDAEENRYNRSANCFTEGLAKVKAYHFLQGLGLLLQAFFGSRCYRDKMWKYLQQVL